MATDFEKFATDHEQHGHCVGCGGCILDPRPEVQGSWPLWCIACARSVVSAPAARIKPTWVTDEVIDTLDSRKVQK